MSLLLFVAALQLAPPVVDPILEPSRDSPAGDVSPALPDAETVPPPTVETVPAPSPAEVRLAACARLSESDAQAAIAEGARWLLENGGIDGEQCLAFGYTAAEQWGEAAAAFDRAAGLAEADDPRLPLLLSQAGNAALAGDDAEAARSRFDRALAVSTIDQELRGQTLIDRARAHVSLGDADPAQADLIVAQTLVPQEPMVWLFSATLARLTGDLDEAGEFIDRALELDQADAAINLEAGNIAIRMNAPEIARQAWTRAAETDSGGLAAQAAQANLDQLAAQMEGNVPVEMPELPDGAVAEESATTPDAGEPTAPAPEPTGEAEPQD